MCVEIKERLERESVCTYINWTNSDQCGYDFFLFYGRVILKNFEVVLNYIVRRILLDTLFIESMESLTLSKRKGPAQTKIEFPIYSTF